MQQSEREASLRAKVTGLVAFRIAIAVVLLGGSFSGQSLFEDVSLRAAVVGLFGTALGTLIALWLGYVRRLLIAAQVLFDIVAMSVVVWFTGGAQSPFAFLFSIVVIEAAGASRARVTMLVGLAAACALTLVSVLRGEPVGTALIAQVAAVLGVATLSATLVTRLLRTESQLARFSDLHERVLRGLTSGILSVDARGVVGFKNPAAERILGDAGLPPELAAESANERGEIEITRDGKRVTLGYSVVPLLGDDGVTVGRTLIFRDLTAIRNEEARHRLNAELAVLGRLAANLAHEIRNPLGSLSGSIELIQQSAALEKDDKALLDIVLREVGRIEALVREFLEYARPQTAERLQSDLGLIAEETVRMFRQDPMLGERTLTLSARKAVALVDPGQMRQVLLNLLRNAVDATSNKGHISVEVQPGLLAVTDDGAGMSPESMSHAFEPFASKREGRFSLGLAIVAQLVQQNGGIVSVARTGGTTRFEMRFEVD